MGVLHHAEALSGVAETFDHHAAGGARQRSLNAKPAGRVADAAARRRLAYVGDVRAQPCELRPT